MKQLFITTLLILSFASIAQNKQSNKWLNHFLSDKSVKNAAVSICVSNVETGAVLLDKNADMSITPASTLKIITSATAHEVFGKDYCFETKLSYSGEIIDSTLFGNLLITAGGDPSLGSAYVFGSNKNDFLFEWAQKIKLLGIDTIYGNIIVDQSIYSDQDVPQTWIWEDLGNYFGAAAQGIAMYDNTFRIVFRADSIEGKETEIIRTEPFIPKLIIKNEVVASNDNRDRAFIFGSPFDSYRIIRGTIPKGKEEYRIKASIPNPADVLAFELKNTLAFNGVFIICDTLNCKFINATHQTSDSLFFIYKSPPLYEIIKMLNNESINLFAEHLCKHIGLKMLNDGSTQSGIKAIKSFWKEKGVDTKFMYLADGSGLSRANAISAKTLIEVLTYMNKESTNFELFRNSLPLTGLEGTQKYYFQNSFLKGKARAKSGSMTRVRSFSGYMTTKNGTPIAFAVIVNNFNCESFDMATKMEKLMEGFYLDF